MELSVDKKARKLRIICILGFISGGAFSLTQLLVPQNHLEKLFFLLFFIIMIYITFYILKQPIKIKLSQKNKIIKFSSRFTNKSFPISSLNRIEIDNQILSFYFIDKKVTMQHQITGLHLLINELKLINNKIEVYGC